MEDGLCCEKRRRKIVEFLIVHKTSTREELAREFHVSKRTITRDIVKLSPEVPIFTIPGNQGGVYILPEYKMDREYLTLAEEQCLRDLAKEVCYERRVILLEILDRFTFGYIKE